MTDQPTIGGTTVVTPENGETRTLVITLGRDALLVRSALLTDGVHDVVRFLANAEEIGPQGSIVIDARVGDLPTVGLRSEAEAFLAAVKALLHSWVLEKRESVAPANMIISSPEQEMSRQATVDYFTDPHGQFSRGSVIDLRRQK